MSKYLDPKNDLLFKKIFGAHKDVLINFLNAILPLGDREIETVEYLTPEQVPSAPLGKNSIIDVRCIDNTGRVLIVEMQMEWSGIFRKRLLLNGSKAVVHQFGKKSIDEMMPKYTDMEPVYIVAVINDNFSAGASWYHNVQLVDPKNLDVVIVGLNYILLELPKFKPETWSLAEKKAAVLWLRFFKEMGEHTKEIPKELKEDKYISAAIEMCEVSGFTFKELQLYDQLQEAARWEETIKHLEKVATESKVAIEEKDKTIEEKDKELEKRDKELEEKEKALAAQEAEIERLKVMMGII